jgi:putative DNA primase/helicase
MRASDYEHFASELDAEIGFPEEPTLPPQVVLTSGDALNPEPVSWLWRDWLALGKVHILAGAPGQGKTTIAMALAAAVTTAGRWPDGSRAEGGNILIWSGEDDPADTLLPRLVASGADRAKCFFVDGVMREGQNQPFDPARDVPMLKEAIGRIGGISLLVVDPVVSAVSGDGNKNNDVRRALQPLVDLASSCRCAVLGITHFSKGGQGSDPTQRVVGSVAFSAVARVVMVAAKVKGEDGEDRRIFARSKSNIGPDDGGYQYFLEQVEALPGIDASRATWGQAVQGNARELLTDATEDDEKAPRDGAADFLREVLKDGPVPTKSLKAEAMEAGHTWRTLRRAADELLVIKRKGGMSDGWYWQLPKLSTKDAKESNLGEWTPSHSSVDTFEHEERL